MKIGILSLQGAVGPHKLKLEELGVTPVEVKRAKHLEIVQGIILPGGESTTMLHLLKLNELWEPLKLFTKTKPSWGICAGAILLAKQVSHPKQDSLEAMDINVERNAFGRQAESFISKLSPEGGTPWPEVEGVFIRAPRIRGLHATVRTLFKLGDEPVMVEQNHLLASTFHPELTASSTIHQYFVSKARDYRG